MLMLLAADVAAIALAAFAVVPWWGVAIPAALAILYLVVCRRQVRRASKAAGIPKTGSSSPATHPRRAVRIDTAYGSAPWSDHDGVPADGAAVSVHVPGAEAVPATLETADGGSLWDPLPVTLPTYVHKARASRTVRTIDLSAPVTWSSGRDESGGALVGDTNASETLSAPLHEESPRAVGS